MGIVYSALAKQWLNNVRGIMEKIEDTQMGNIQSAAEVMANRFKTEHYEVVMHAGDMEWVLPKLIWHVEDLRVA